MKIFEMPNIEVITFTVEGIMAPSINDPAPELPTGNNRLPWG